MRILIVTPQIPIPSVSKCGAAVRNYSIIKHLCDWHDLHLLTLVSSEDEIESIGHLKNYCSQVWWIQKKESSGVRRVIRTCTRATPDLSSRLVNPELAGRFRELAEDGHYDVLQIEGLELSWLFLGLSDIRPKKVLDEHNAEYVLALRNMHSRLRSGSLHLALYSAIQSIKLRHYERKMLNSVDLGLTISEFDRILLKRLAPAANLLSVPASVDMSEALADFKSVKNDIVLVGAMDYKPNEEAAIWFCRDIMPKIRAALANVRLHIVGKRPSGKVLKLAEEGSVIVTGAVDSIESYYLKAKLAIVPIRTVGGSSMKCLEAMSYGLPVVTTTQMAKVLDPPIRDRVFACDNAGEFAKACLRLMSNEEEWHKASYAARHAINDEYSNRQAIQKLNEAYELICVR